MIQRLLAGVTLVFACNPFAANAAIVEQLITFPGLNNAVEGTGVGEGNAFSMTHSFPGIYDLFDPSLGTLTEVKFIFDYRFEITLDLPAMGGGGGGSTAGLFFLNGETKEAYGDGGGNGGGGAPNSSVVVPYVVEGVYAVPGTVTDDPHTVANFLAVTPGQKGTFDFQANVTVNPNDGVHAATDFLPTSTVKVEYTYTPVPEPATAGLLLVGGMAVLRRRRK